MSFFDGLTERVEGFLDELFVSDEVRTQVERASRLIERDDYEQAERLLSGALDEEPNVHRIHQLLGLCYLEQDDAARAAETLDRALELREDATSHFYAGLAAERTDAPERARLHYHRGLGLAEDHPFEVDVHIGLGRVYLQLDRPDRAANELEKAVAQEPRRADARRALARAELRRGELEAADELVAGLEGEDDGPEVPLLRAELAAQRSGWETAADAFDRAVDVEDGPERLEALVGSARAYLELGNPARARTRLLRALESVDRGGDREAELQLLLGRAFASIDDPERALQPLKRSIECADEEGDVAARAHLQLGKALFDLGRIDDARDHLEPASRHAATLDRGRLALARCRLADGETAPAHRLLDELRDAPQVAVRARRLLATAALRQRDPARAAVELQEALYRTDDPGVRESLETERENALRQLAPDWNLPDRVTQPSELERVLDETESHLGSTPPFEPFRDDLRALENALTSPLSVAVVGEFNAGKSTLVNGLVGEEVVPMGVLPTTAHTCIFTYGPRKSARLVYENAGGGGVAEVDFREARRRMDEEAEAIDHLEFHYPHPQLRSVEFWDTPGFNAADDRDGDGVATRALQRAEAILWVVDATQTLSRTEFDVLDDIPDSADRVLVVLNKIDQLPTDGDSSEQIDRLADRVRTAVGDDIAGVFGLSARRALEARTADGAEDSQRFESFERELDLRLTQRSGAIKTDDGRRRLGGIAVELQATADRMTAELDSLADRAGELHEWLEERSESLPDESAGREVRSVEDGVDFALRAVAGEIRELLRPRGTLFPEMKLPDADQSYALDLLERRYTDVLARSRDRVLEDVEAVADGLTRRTHRLLNDLPSDRSRPFDRRIEGLYDEIRAMRVVLDERVYGRLLARAKGRIRAVGPDALADGPGGEGEIEDWTRQLRDVVPEASRHVDGALRDWYREFFVAVRRFSNRVRRDIRLLELESEHRHDFQPLLDLLGTD